MDGIKFGVEAEYALVRPDGRFADFTNTSYEEVSPFIEALPDCRHPDLRVGDAGIRVKHWYVEGDERFDDAGRSTGMTFKGIEVRTAPFPAIEESIASLAELRSMLQAVLGAEGWSCAAIGFNPYTSFYRPTYTAWELAFQASHVAHRLPEVSTLSFGPDLNFSIRDDTPEQVLQRVRRLTFYSPYIVPFSFSSPFADGELWDGLSYRTFRRTGGRPAALAHLAGAHDHQLVRQADPPSQHLRIEFKAFDMVADDELLAELFYLILGIALADDRDIPGAADITDRALHRRVAKLGFADVAVHNEAARVLRVARSALKTVGGIADLPLLEQMLTDCRTPAHRLREDFGSTGSVISSIPIYPEHRW